MYTGDANEITLKDLEPATSYQLRVYAALPAHSPAGATLCRGEFTAPVTFETRACEPAQPDMPKMLAGAKKKNELGVRWQAPVDNGSKILSFTLEYQAVTHALSGILIYNFKIF